MHHSWNDQPIDVAENFLKRFTLFRWLGRQRRADRTGLAIRRDSQLGDVFPKVSDPIRKLMKLFPKNFRRRIAKRWSIFHALERESETEMKRAEVFARSAIRIPSVIEADRTDR